MNGQHEANPMFRLATRAGKMGLSCLLGIAHFVPAKAKFWPYIINPSLTELVRSRWLDIGLVLFAFLKSLISSQSIKMQKKKKKRRTWPISSHLARTSLVNNAYSGLICDGFS